MKTFKSVASSFNGTDKRYNHAEIKGWAINVIDTIRKIFFVSFNDNGIKIKYNEKKIIIVEIKQYKILENIERMLYRQSFV